MLFRSNVTRKSTTGVAIKYGGFTVKTYARNQKVIALSSAEAELYAIVSGVSEALGVKALLKDLGVEVKVRCFTDSNAAIGITKRLGLGKIRHMQTRYLWIQDLVTNGHVQICKINTHVNSTDLMTKYLDSSTIQTHVKLLNLQQSITRPTQAPTLQCNQISYAPYANWQVDSMFSAHLLKM